MKTWNKEIQIIEYNGKIVIANHLNGSWTRMPKDIFDIVTKFMQSEAGENFDFEDKEDEKFIIDLISYLEETQAIISSSLELQNKTVSIEITHRCNLHCIHCCIDADNTQRTKEISTYDMKKILDKCVEWNPMSIMLSGGEPLLRNDFAELLIYLRKNYKGKIIISTNGLLISQSMAKILVQNIDQIDISLDGVDEETTSLIRGKGVFGKVMQAIKLLHNENFWHITLSLATADRNQYLEDRFDKLCETLKVQPVKRLFSAIGRGKESKEMFSRKTEKETYIPEDYLSDSYSETFGVSNCSGGVRELFIRYDGDVYPCPIFLDKECVMGNALKTDSLAELVQNAKISVYDRMIQKLEIFAGDRCKKCKVQPFCWTCPGSVEDMDTKDAFEDYCNQIRGVLYKRVWGEEV